MSITRTYHDPLHYGISLNSDQPEEAMVLKLIDSEPFQRLRRIRQLGPAFLTFHGAESSRFTHSLGVFHIARRSLNRLQKSAPELNKFRGLLYGSALLHDLGHGPLSHTSEDMFGINHEKWTARLIREHKVINEILEGFEGNMSEQIADLIENNKSPHKVVKALVSSQLDCDRLDYLLRDSYSTGTRYGQLDLERIISALTLAPDGDLAIHPKGLMAVEHYLVVRHLMYKGVYNHRLNVVCNWLLEQIIRNARTLGPGKVWADKCISQWLWHPKNIDLDTFIGNDDIRVGYHFLRWQEEAPKPLSELCSKFLNRRLLKAIDVEHLNKVDQLEALAIARKLSERNGKDPDLSCGLKHQKLHGYHPYKGGLRLWDGMNLKALEQVSTLVKMLINPTVASWLIYPKEIDFALKKEINLLPKNQLAQPEY